MQLFRATALIVLALTSDLLGATFVVSNTNDAGPGSLRQAITDANANPNAGGTIDSIIFQINAGSGVRTIAPTTSLPSITEAVAIDGYTQPGSAPNTNDTTKGLNGTPLIELSGNNRPYEVATHALRINSSANNVTIRGLIINRWYTALSILGGTGHYIIGNYIGTDATGTTAPVHSTAGKIQTNGIIASGTVSMQIGDGSAAGRNLISGSQLANVFIVGSDTTDNRVLGNLIGTNAAGDADLSNVGGEIGVAIGSGAKSNTIGGASAAMRNIISGNDGVGVLLSSDSGPVVTGNLIAGNYIGTDVTGTRSVSNGDGIRLQGQNNTIGGSAAPGGRNVISGNFRHGIEISSLPADPTVQNAIENNYIGCDVTGTRALSNGGTGVMVLPGASNNSIGKLGGAGAGNTIAYNNERGVQIASGGAPDAVGNVITGNAIFRNGGLGIDLGVGTPNSNDAGDADSGPNNLQNHPVLTSATGSIGQVKVIGTLNSLPSQGFRIEIYADTAADASGRGEGRYFLGVVNVLTNAAGDASFELNVPFRAETAVISALAISTTNDTSEFSAAIPISGAPSRLLNISTRMRVLTGDNVLIGGFILTGSEAKRVLVRGLGPSLNSSGVASVLPNPSLELFNGEGTLIAANDNWKDTQQAQIQATGIPPTNDLESAILDVLTPGNYTAVLADFAGQTGVGLVEVYDLEQTALSKLANVSTRGFVDTGDNVMIGGVIVGGPGTGNAGVVVRAIGPSLSGQGITNPLADPTLELVNGSGVTIATNDNWRETQEAQLQATGLQPTNDAEAAVVAAVAPGNYTAIVRGKNDTTGIALVEVYNVP